MSWKAGLCRGMKLRSRICALLGYTDRRRCKHRAAQRPAAARGTAAGVSVSPPAGPGPSTPGRQRPCKGWRGGCHLYVQRPQNSPARRHATCCLDYNRLSSLTRSICCRTERGNASSHSCLFLRTLKRL